MVAIIQTINGTEQRYNTVGDWFFSDRDKLIITISDVGDEKYHFLIAVHELIEAYLCKFRGITQDAVDNFDMSPEQLKDPGGDSRAPYHREHMFAEGVEMALAKELGINWEEYEKRLEAL